MPSTNRKTKIHFEISERKVLLRIIDVLSVGAAMFLLGTIFHIDYFHEIYESWTRSGFLIIYLLSLGAVFEMYNLQVASNQLKITKSVLIAGSLTVLLYILTPIYAPELPKRRIEILFFYLAIVGSIFVWRMVYVRFFASNRFKKNAILLVEDVQCEQLVAGLGIKDPHYKIVG